MKFLRVFLGVLLLFLFCGSVYAAGSVVEQSRTWTINGDDVVITVKLLCTGDASAGTVPDFTFTNLDPNRLTPSSLSRRLSLRGSYIIRVETWPGSPAPNAYTLKFYSSRGGIEGALLLDIPARSATDKETETGSYTLGDWPPIDDGLIMKTGDLGTDKTTTVYVTFAK